MSERIQDKPLNVWTKTVAIAVWFIPLLMVWVTPGIIDFPMWASMTISGIAMGCLFFLMAIGLTITFGLMDVLNFAHGIFFTMGAYVAWRIFSLLIPNWVMADSFWINSAAILLAIAAAAIVNFMLGLIMEKYVFRQTYGDHLKQILITMGLWFIGEEVIRILGLSENQAFMTPAWYADTFELGDVLVIRYQIFSILMGLLFFVLIQWVLNKTKIGLIVRAGVENPNMIKAMGYNLNRVFTGVFATGAILAGIGGLMWAGYDENVNAEMGGHNLVFAFVVVVIAGPGSVKGTLLGAIMVGVFANYMTFFMPQLAAASLVLLMCAILMLKPSGLFPQK